MRKSWLLCVLLGTLALGQAAPTAPPGAQSQAPAAPGKPAPPADMSASVPDTAAVITVNGVCAPKPKIAAKGAAATPAAAKTAAASKPEDCKTVITKAEFEKLANSVAPNITPQLKRQLAGVLPRLIAMSNQAKQKGLDKTPRYEETLKFAKMQILTNELQKSVTEEAAKVPTEQVAEYYKTNPEAYEQYNLERLFVPRTKQVENEAQEENEDKDKKEKPTEEERRAKEAEAKAKQESAEQEMTKLAETLRGRAAAGEDFVKLQKEAFDAAGMKVESPTVSLPKVRRTGLPPAHAAVFELKPGEVTPVINDSGGHYIYKLNAKDELALDQVKDEIHNTLQNQRSRDMMDKINASFKVETNEAYFGGSPMGGGAPPPRMPSPRMAPAPTAPQPKPQTPPASQAPPPEAKPN